MWRGINPGVVYPACSKMASSMAQREPLPLVPATVITGQVKEMPMRCATLRTRFQRHVDGHRVQLLAIGKPVVQSLKLMCHNI